MKSYWIGDPCYVLHDVWSEICDRFEMWGSPPGTTSIKCSNATVVLLACTAYGDGVYEDQEGRRYPVDSGMLGIVAVEDIKDDRARLDLGHIFEFDDNLFLLLEKDGRGTFTFGGKVKIRTG